MKLNKWTVALAAAGVVSFASAAKAEEQASSVMTALSSTTLSGYVDTSMQWNLGTGNQFAPPYKFGGPAKADGFNLDVVQLRIDRPLSEADWAAGYRVDLWAGPDANALGTQSVFGNNSRAFPGDFAIRQAYIALRAPIGNGLDFKVGVFDSPIGYESVESPNDPNYTRSYGNTIEPQTQTGVLASYRFSELFSASAGVADTIGPVINDRAQFGSAGFISGPFSQLFYAAGQSLGLTPAQVNGGVGDLTGANAYAESYKAYMGSVALTAPDSMGFLAGSTLYAGVVNGFNNSVLGSGVGNAQTSVYAGATVATPVTGLRAGAAFDFLRSQYDEPIGGLPSDVDLKAYSIALYASYQATEKLSFHARGEYFDANLDATVPDLNVATSESAKIWALTGTVQYDLWKNVISRVELRWDHADNRRLFGGATADGLPDRRNAWMLAGNIIYKF